MDSQIITFFIVSFFLVISPGPNMALVIDSASRLGKMNSLANVAGLCTATYVHGILSIVGVSAILLKNENIYSLLKNIGGSYLLYIGLKSLIAGLKSIKNSKSTTSTHEKIAEKIKKSRSYFDGFTTQILNPKVSVFYITVFPKYLSGSDNIKRGFELVTIHSFNIFAWFTILTIFVSFASVTLKKQKVRSYINIATGLVLSLFSVFIFIG